jgi:hypothetical protein
MLSASFAYVDANPRGWAARLCRLREVESPKNSNMRLENVVFY